MGSLMSGWSSSVLSEKEARLMRNRSLTKEEVAAFWRHQQQHGRPAPEPNAAGGSPRAEILVPVAAKRRLEATRSLPPLPGRGGGITRSNDDLTCCSAYGYGAGDQQLVSSRSEPPSPAAMARREGFFLPENAAADSSGMSRGWWTRSSWAFLNEPPREELLLGRAQRSFACDQFHAARIVTARLMRNRSLTKEEVAAFWRQQQQHGRPAPEQNAGGSPRAGIVPLAAKRRLEVTRSLPPLSGRWSMIRIGELGAAGRS